jgi:hypothetical protein
MCPQPHAPPQQPPPEGEPSPGSDAAARPPLITMTGVNTRRAAAVPHLGQAGDRRRSYSATEAMISNSWRHDPQRNTYVILITCSHDVLPERP